MLRIWQTAVSAVLVLAISGCVAPEIPFDRSTAQVQSIGIVTPKFPSEPTVAVAATVGQSFGLIGALIDAGIQANREQRFGVLVADQRYAVQDRFIAELTTALKARGYQVSVIELPRNASDFLDKYPMAADSKVDAYLDVVTNSYGYVAAGIGLSLPYRPFFSAKARLVSAKDTSVLMQDAIFYNPVGPTQKTVTIAPDPQFQFPSFDNLVADPAKAVQGMDTATAQSAQTIGGLLQ